jgi:hypothetical protein
MRVAVKAFPMVYVRKEQSPVYEMTVHQMSFKGCDLHEIVLIAAIFASKTVFKADPAR